MFGKVKKQENQYVIAVKNLSETVDALEKGTLRLPFDKSIYRDLLATSVKKADNKKDMKALIKYLNKSKNEVSHYWEGLITDGYTIMEVHYDKRNPTIERMCSSEVFKYISMA